VPSRSERAEVGFEDRGFGHEDVGAGSESGEGFDEEGAQEPFGPVAPDGVAHLFPGDERDLRVGAFPEKEDEPGGMPDFVGPLVDAVELTLAGEGLKVLYTANLFLPLARRALMTLRPFLVFIRVRKPWVRLRGVLWG